MQLWYTSYWFILDFLHCFQKVMSKADEKEIKPIKISVWAEKLFCHFPQDSELDKICAGIFTKILAFIYDCLPILFQIDNFQMYGLLFLWFVIKMYVWNIWSKQWRTVHDGKPQACYSVTITSGPSGSPEAGRPLLLFDEKATLPWK